MDYAKAKGNKSSITIPFVHLTKDPNELYRLCKQFSFETIKQGSGLGQIVTRALTGDDLKNVVKFTITTISKKGSNSYYDLLRGINTGDAVVYGTVNDGGLEYPVLMKELMIASFNDVSKLSVAIGDRVYYKTFETETTVTGPDVKNYVKGIVVKVRLSENITLSFEHLKTKFKFNLNSDLMQIKKDAEFILDLLDKQYIDINGQRISFYNINVDKAFTNRLQDMIEVGKVLEEIGLNIDIPFKKLTKDDGAKIDLLVNIRKGRRTFKTNLKVFQYIWSFRGKKWPLIVYKRDRETKLYGYVFNDRMKFSLGNYGSDKNPDKSQSDAWTVPNFTGLEPDVLANLYYYDYESMYNQVDAADVNMDTANELNNLALNLITAYDLNNNEKLLGIAEELLKRLIDAEPDVIRFLINLCQIEVRRYGQAVDDDLEKVDRLEAEISKNIKDEKQEELRKASEYCIAVIKKNVELADRLYKRLDDAGRSGIDGWPIRTLHMKLKKSA